jgi:MoxR-like ATPase
MGITETAHRKFKQLFNEVGKVVVGQDEPIMQMVACLLANSNALLESYPGLAKTLSINTLASLMDLDFSRVQGTPDLMPSDVTGTYVIDESGARKVFRFEKGPVFTNVLLMDEINRATPKTQSSLLEAMQEKQVTMGNKTFELDTPFFVLATQNPIDQEGTYPLPEAQSDRFLMKIKLDYPKVDEELEIVNRYTSYLKPIEKKVVLKKTELLALQKYTLQVPVSNDIKKYVVDLINKTRKTPKLIEYGASPRASIGLILAAKASAMINGRAHVNKSDVQAMAFPVLRHRIVLTFEAERNGMSPDDVIKKLL